jgi:hypothetical protein
MDCPKADRGLRMYRWVICSIGGWLGQQHEGVKAYVSLHVESLLHSKEGRSLTLFRV